MPIKILNYLITLCMISIFIITSQAITISGGPSAISDGSGTMQGIVEQNESSYSLALYGLGNGLGYYNQYTSDDGHHSVIEKINTTSKAFTYTGSVSKGWNYVNVYRDFSVKNGILIIDDIRAKYDKDGQRASSGFSLEIKGTGSGNLALGSDEKGRKSGGTYGPLRAYSNVRIKNFKGPYLHINNYPIRKAPYTPNYRDGISEGSGLTVINGDVVSTKANTYPIRYQAQVAQASDWERKFGARIHGDTHLWFDGKADRVIVSAYGESLGTCAWAYSGWNSFGKGKLEAYSSNNDAKYAVPPTTGASAIDNVYAKTKITTDSNTPYVTTFTSKSGLKLTTKKLIPSGDITKFDFTAYSHAIYPPIYPSVLRTYESFIKPGADKLTAVGVETKVWNWNEGPRAWSVLNNQYGMDRYYTTIPITWRFNAVDRPDYAHNPASHLLISKAGDLNDDGIVTRDEWIKVVEIYITSTDQITDEYAKQAEINYKSDNPTCLQDGSSCNQDGQCCSDWCSDYKCTSKPSCLPDGSSCNQDGQCCSGWCPDYHCASQS